MLKTETEQLIPHAPLECTHLCCLYYMPVGSHVVNEATMTSHVNCASEYMTILQVDDIRRTLKLDREHFTHAWRGGGRYESACFQ